MSDGIPRKLPRTQGQRVQNVARTHAAQSLGGGTAAARPVQDRKPDVKLYQSSGGGNVVTGTGAASAVSITSTAAGAGTSAAAGGEAVAIGDSSVASGLYAVAVGQGPTATANSTVAVGVNAQATQASAVAVGASALATQSNAVALGHGAEADGASSTAILGYAGGAYSTAISPSAAANEAGTVAIGTDSSGGGASADNVNDFVLGTVNHHVIVPGTLQLTDISAATIETTGTAAVDSLVVAGGAQIVGEALLSDVGYAIFRDGGVFLTDTSGGLHKLIVSTGGALSTVAYP